MYYCIVQMLITLYRYVILLIMHNDFLVFYISIIHCIVDVILHTTLITLIALYSTVHLYIVSLM